MWSHRDREGGEWPGLQWSDKQSRKADNTLRKVAVGSRAWTMRLRGGPSHLRQLKILGQPLQCPASILNPRRPSAALNTNTSTRANTNTNTNTNTNNSMHSRKPVIDKARVRQRAHQHVPSTGRHEERQVCGRRRKGRRLEDGGAQRPARCREHAGGAGVELYGGGVDSAEGVVHIVRREHEESRTLEIVHEDGGQDTAVGRSGLMKGGRGWQRLWDDSIG